MTNIIYFYLKINKIIYIVLKFVIPVAITTLTIYVKIYLFAYIQVPIKPIKDDVNIYFKHLQGNIGNKLISPL